MENFTELRNFDLIIAGGGAAGIMAAGIAAQAGFSVLVCEKMEKPQRKVRITGKGRCNLTNIGGRRNSCKKSVALPTFSPLRWHGSATGKRSLFSNGSAFR